MPTSAPGSPEPRQRAVGRQRGFTLLELLVVVSIVALATAGVSLSLRDASATQLEREAQRLVALLESARAQSRALGTPVFWRPGPQGFELNGEFRPWLTPGTTVHALNSGTGRNAPGEPLRVALGPDPLMAPQRLSLSLEGRTLWLSTDGLRPFKVSDPPPESAP